MTTANTITVILHVKYIPSVEAIKLEVDSVENAAGLYKKNVPVMVDMLTVSFLQ